MLTSLRAVPARGGGAGSRSETREATHCQEPPHRCHGARLPRLSLCVRLGRDAWGAPEPGVSPGTRQMRGSGAAVPAAAPPPPLPRGAPAPFPVSKCCCLLCLREAGERVLGCERGSLG